MRVVAGVVFGGGGAGGALCGAGVAALELAAGPGAGAPFFGFPLGPAGGLGAPLLVAGVVCVGMGGGVGRKGKERGAVWWERSLYTMWARSVCLAMWCVCLSASLKRTR